MKVPLKIPQPAIDKRPGRNDLIQAVTEPFCYVDTSNSELMPLRDRDLEVLTDLFSQDEIEAIEADILWNLDRRAPEPCWEDDPFDFLRDYL
ncbi:MAG: hypothetical protein Kow00121_49370 [Elainellaceae cyanobacterium]